jgi:HK97 family phage prohead protease
VALPHTRTNQRERKAFALEVKDLNDAGVFVGLASVYGNVDLQGDIVDPGAFTKSIAERGADVPILWQHDQTEPIGLGTLSDSADGLLIKGHLDLDTPQGARAYSALKKGYVKGLSIGYDVVKQKFDKGSRHLIDLKLYEVSTVTFPANEAANVVAVKALDALPAFVQPIVAALTKDVSLQDKLCAVYEAVQAAYPLANAYVVDVFDDHVIVASGEKFFSIALTWGADGDDAALGAVTEVERTYTPLAEAADSIDNATKAVKVGRTLSSANASALTAAHDHMTKAAGHVAAVLASAATAPKALDIPADDALVAVAGSLKALNDTMRRAIAPAQE